MRKYLIGLITFVLVLLVFALYTSFFRTPAISVLRDSDLPEVRIPVIDEQSSDPEQTTVGTVESSRFVFLDENTKQVRQILGFEKLLSRDPQSPYRELVKPYMEPYEKNFKATITADTGSVQLETAGDIQVPKEARLAGNVVIKFTTGSGENPFQTEIFLDDLYYSSERSEFSTEKRVKLISPQAQLQGTGMILMYNARLGRLEYFRIGKLEELRIKNVDLLSAGGDSASDSAGESPKGPDKNESERVDYYQCVFAKDVLISYGDVLNIIGVDEVAISNIVWSGGSSGLHDSVGDSEKSEAAVQKGNEPEASSVDVVIKCSGGMLVRPVASPLGSDDPVTILLNRTVEMSGRPIDVKTTAPKDNTAPKTIIRCGIIRYDIDRDILNLFTNAYYKFVTLYMTDTDASIRTAGWVKWNRRQNQADIHGPGRLLLRAGNDSSAPAGGTEMNFPGLMNLVFAEPHADWPAKLVLKKAGLAGGFTAQSAGKSTATTSADSADILFNDAGKISIALLKGDVNFTSVENDVQTTAFCRQADCLFKDDELITVNLEGMVKLASAQGVIESARAKIQFAEDAGGGTSPEKFEGADHVVLVPASSDKSALPASFKAAKIDYDIKTGNALAEGPIEAVFYLSSSDSRQDNTPVTITAGHAEFLAGEDKRIREVTLSENVQGQKTSAYEAFTRLDTFKCDKLLLEMTSGVSAEVRKLTLSDGNVQLESIRSAADGAVISHVRMLCDRLDYYTISSVIIASGPGFIELDNSKSPQSSQPDSSPVNLQRPCYARIEGFEKLKWTISQNVITAEGEPKGMNLGYIPVVNGALGPAIRASAAKVTTQTSPDDSGKIALERLDASGGFYFEQQDKHLFTGDSAVYDASSAILKIAGSENQPCYADGGRVPRIEYNLETGEVSFKLSSTPGSVSAPTGPLVK